MKKYELVLMFDPKSTEDRVKSEVDAIAKLCEGQGGKELVLQNWGRVRLAHEINQCGEAYFRGIFFTADDANSEIINFLTSRLRINDTLIKFQVHRLSSKRKKIKARLNRIPSSDDDFYDDRDSRY